MYDFNVWKLFQKAKKYLKNTVKNLNTVLFTVLFFFKYEHLTQKSIIHEFFLWTDLADECFSASEIYFS